MSAERRRKSIRQRLTHAFGAELIDAVLYLGLARIAFQGARIKNQSKVRPFLLLIQLTQFDERPRIARVEMQRLLEALKKAVTRLPAEHMQAIDQLAKATNTRRRHLSVHERGRVILVPLDQVIYLKAELKYITVRTREREYLIEESLTSLEEEFGDRFVRIHRNALVARPSIAGFERVTPTSEEEAGDPYWQVVLRDIAERLPVSRRQWSMVKNLVT